MSVLWQRFRTVLLWVAVLIALAAMRESMVQIGPRLYELTAQRGDWFIRAVYDFSVHMIAVAMICAFICFVLSLALALLEPHGIANPESERQP